MRLLFNFVSSTWSVRVYSYAEAHKMKLKANSLEGWELEKQQNQRQQQMFKKEAKFKHKQQQESRALKKRITSGRETQKRQRQFDLERCAYYGNRGVLHLCVAINFLYIQITIQPFRLLQRYQNVKQELEQQQNLERIRAEKFFKRTFKKNWAPICDHFCTNLIGMFAGKYRSVASMYVLTVDSV